MQNVLQPASPAEKETGVELLHDFSDRWNPLLVRELRRMLKSRLFGSSFLLLLAGCLGSTYVLVAMSPEAVQYDEAGKQFASAYLCLLSAALIFVVPLSMFLAVSQERSENTLEMLSITTLWPEQIFFGFLMCGFAHALLYLSVLVPFISFSYLLRGIELANLLACLFFLGLLAVVNALWSTMLGACVTGGFSRIVCFIFSFLGNLLAFLVASALNTLTIQLGEEMTTLGPELFVCMFLPLFFLLPVTYGVAIHQLSLYNIGQKPYRVILDEQGNIVRFKPYYNDPYYGDEGAPIPKELLESLKPSANSPEVSVLSDRS